MNERKYSFKVRKGLETPLLIKGMEMQYFYGLAGVAAILVFYLVGELIAFTQDLTGANFIQFVISVIVCFFILLGLKLFFTSKSNRKTYRFRNTTKTISNIDILNSIEL